MNVRPVGCDLVNGLRRQLAITAFGYHQLGAIGKKLRGAAFIGLYVGRLTANDSMIGLAKRSKRQGICGGAIEGKEDLAIGLKQFPEGIGRSRRPGIVAIAGDVAAIGSIHGRPCLRTNAGIVVTCELLQKIGVADFTHIV